MRISCYAPTSGKPRNLPLVLPATIKCVKTCPVTYALIDADEEVSSLYDNPKRTETTIAVVEEPLDIVALEKTKQFHGTYHVLVLAP